MKYALVTGGGRGIGRAACIKLAQMGYKLLINYVSNSDAAQETLNLVKEAGSDGELLKFNVAEFDKVKESIESWKAANPEATIEVLVNNAGIRKDGLMLWMEKSDWDAVLDISVDGFFNATKNVIDGMVNNKFGRIINIVSFSGLTGVAGQTNYSASKGAIIAATRSLAKEVGRRRITVNAIAPGFIKTDMTEDIDEKQYKQAIALGRFGKAEEVANLIGFLASEESSYITGEVISINGGL